MPWAEKKPPKENKHTMKARKLDAKADRALRRGNPSRAAELGDKADRAARKGGWF